MQNEKTFGKSEPLLRIMSRSLAMSQACYWLMRILIPFGNCRLMKLINFSFQIGMIWMNPTQFGMTDRDVAEMSHSPTK